MRRLILFTLSLICFASAGYLAWREHERYQTARAFLPAGSTIAHIPVGGLTASQAADRLSQVYLQTPVQARFESFTASLDPRAAGFALDLDSMLSAAFESSSFTYQDWLLNKLPAPVSVDLKASLAGASLRSIVTEQIAPQFAEAPTAPYPIAGQVEFVAASGGRELDVDDAVAKLSPAFTSLDHRVVDLTVRDLPALPPDFARLEPMLAAILQTSGFDGTAELYMQDLSSGKEINLAYHQGQFIQPGIAFTAASTIKIPVMVSAFRHINDYPPSLQKQMEMMIDVSDNGSTDEVMTRAIGENIAPLDITADMRALGLQNTFLAGMFYSGAPLLQVFDSPANRRSDVTTEPDIYNQTSPADMGRLLASIQRCADQGDGPILSALSGQVTQDECREMLALLVKNRKAVLIEVGLPEGSTMAHKYGWVTDPTDGLMHTLSDAAIVYTPGGNFVLSIYLYHREQLLWDEATVLMARLTSAAEHYYRLNTLR